MFPALAPLSLMTAERFVLVSSNVLAAFGMFEEIFIND